MLQTGPPCEAPRDGRELAALGIVGEWLEAGRDPLMLQAHPQCAALVAIPREQVDAADLRRATEPSEDVADVAIPVGGSQESRSGIGDRVENRLASANRRLEAEHTRIVQRGKVRHHELAGDRSHGALHTLIHSSRSRAIVWSIAAPSLSGGIGRWSCSSSLALRGLQRTSIMVFRMQHWGDGPHGYSAGGSRIVPGPPGTPRLPRVQ